MSTPAARRFEAQARELEALKATVAELSARVQALESGRGLWSEPARALRRAIALSTEGALFEAKELKQHARVDPELAAALGAVLLATTREIGAWLRDHRGEGDGIRIERAERSWRVVYCTSRTSSAAHEDALD